MTEAVPDQLAADRRHLLGVAYRMLGSVADAEDAVQETLARWYRLPEADRAEVAVPRAWLTRVVGRVCLDVLGSARARRERYVGEWLPEPVPADFAAPRDPAADPAERAALSESVGLALLVVLDSLPPAERVVLVLHDVFAVPFDEVAAAVGRSPAACRQLAVAARRRVAAARPRPAGRSRHDAVTRAFAAACAGGDLTALVAVLDPDVTLRSDGGGVVSAARHPVRGADRVARFLLGVLAKDPDGRVEEVRTGDGLAYLVRAGERPRALLSLGTDGDRATDVWIVMNPAKLGCWA
ncbi:RNA polymerase sigma factor SigJ [Trujillonella humicola]|uniref:RNA polymerase sigma factor SigJ n=1 Tax=Trujillonella humicola TaxID=3383699 RepID=UPI0039057A2E